MDFIKNSELYKSTEIKDSIPTEYIIDKIELNNLNDLIKLLKICQYWKVEELPWEIYDFIYDNYESEKLTFEDYSDLQDKLNEYDKLIDIRIMLSLYTNNYNVSFTNYRIPLKMNYKLYTEVYFKGIFGYDRINLFKWSDEHNILKKTGYIPISYYCEWASNYNCPKCLQYIVDNKYTINDKCCKNAIDNNNLECLKILHFAKAWWSPKNLKPDIKNKSKECVEFLENNKCLHNINEKVISEKEKREEEIRIWNLKFGGLCFS